MTFTVEHGFADSTITLLDDSGLVEDTEVIFLDNWVLLSQWSEELHRYEVVELTAKQFKELIIAIDKEEGLYR